MRDTAVIPFSESCPPVESIVPTESIVAVATFEGANVGFLIVQQFAWFKTTWEGASSEFWNRPFVSTSGAIVSSEKRCLSSGLGFFNGISSLAN